MDPPPAVGSGPSYLIGRLQPLDLVHHGEEEGVAARVALEGALVDVHLLLRHLLGVRTLRRQPADLKIT